MEQSNQSLSITEVLMNLNEGGTMEELATELRLAVSAVQGTGKKAQVKLTIDIAPNGPTAVSTTEKIDTKMPKADPVATLFYVTPEAGLSRRDPRQPQLDMVGN